MPENRKRIAILGGGVGGLSAAFALSEMDPEGKLFDITLYQLGWRLGGKTANGRNAEYGQRIEEHGLHIWAGFYDNAFTVLRSASRALDLPNGAPNAKIQDVFKPQNYISFIECVHQEWSPWWFWFKPDNDPDLYPGRDSLWDPPTPPPSLAEMIGRILALLAANDNLYAALWDGDPHAETAGILQRMADDVRHWFTQNPAPQGSEGHQLLVHAAHLATQLAGGTVGVTVAELGLLAALRGYRALAKTHYDAAGDGIPADIRHAFIVADLALRGLIGIIRYGCLTKGLQAVDDLELREFLYGEDSHDPQADNVIVTSLYDYTFAYLGGARNAPRISACCAIQGFMRLPLYRGAFFYKAMAGMGDTICSPIYTVLRRRGVTFKFFHEVTSLLPSADGTAIDTILINEQAALAGNAREYLPLVRVKEIDSWPSTPLWEQLAEGARFKREGVNFENTYAPQPPPARRLELQRGVDFDDVICAIPVGALAGLCGGLAQQKPAWAAMLANLLTTRTQALQLWLTCEAKDLGGPFVRPYVSPSGDVQAMGPIAINFTPPFDTYSDMSQLLPAEAWPQDGPKSVAYFCAVLQDEGIPDDQQYASDVVRAASQEWMTSQLHILWNRIGQGAEFDWNLLYSPSNAAGAARLNEQYWRANISPGERYVLSLPNTLQYRLPPGGSGYENLYLAGDWTLVNDINAGCVEVAAMSGLLAASALSGRDIPIAGTKSLKPQ